jgi:hypothetical protein
MHLQQLQLQLMLGMECTLTPQQQQQQQQHQQWSQQQGSAHLQQLCADSSSLSALHCSTPSLSASILTPIHSCLLSMVLQ